jgi:hypothetical protein
MYITVRGANDRELTKWLKIATEYFAKQLMKPYLCDELNIHIKIQKNTINFETKADCMWDDFSEPPNPRIFNIRLGKEQKKNYPYYFKSLAHEMVHVKQYAKNELDGIFGKNNTHVWTGPDFKIPSEIYPKKDIFSRFHLDKNENDYYFQPWEIEAYGLEVGLVYYFVQKYSKELPYGRNEGDWD